MGEDASSSSGEEDGDAAWRAAIASVAAVGFGASAANGRSKPRDPVADGSSSDLHDEHRQQRPNEKSHGLKLYQIKAQKFLDEILDNSLVMVRYPAPIPSEEPQITKPGIRLFRKSPRGIILDPVDPHPQPRKRPQIIPGEEIDEKSKKFRQRIKSVTVNGNEIVVSARNALQQTLARFEARDAARQAAAKCEGERVAKLKKLRGVKWLPSIAREMQAEVRAGEMATLKRRS